MRKGVNIVVVLLFLMPVALAADAGDSIGIDMEVEQFCPLLWMCDSRVVIDDNVQPGRVDGELVYSLKDDYLKGYELVERHNNYAFEGEMIEWMVLVMDKNKIEQIQDVVVTLGPAQVPGNDVEVECVKVLPWTGDLKQDNLCWKSDDTGWACDFEHEHYDTGPTKGSVIYSSDGCCLKAIVDLEGLDPSKIYQMGFNSYGTEEDAYTAFGEICDQPNSPAQTTWDPDDSEPWTAAWECGIWPGDQSFWNFEMDAQPQADGTYTHTYQICNLPVGYYHSKFLVKENGDPETGGDNYPVILMEESGLEWTITGQCGINPACNARIDQEELTEFDPQTMAYYECTFTVETPASMYGEYWVTVEATEATINGCPPTTMDEYEYWFLNPQLGLAIDGVIDFGTVMPGTVSYSDTILVGNDADAFSGVMLDMFISGTDFYDPSSSGARCVISNRLKLGDNFASSTNNADTSSDPSDIECDIGFGDADDHLCYYATNGAYSTGMDPRSDVEGYAPIVYGDSFTPDLYNDAEIIQADRMGAYWGANLLAPDTEMGITFKLGVPVPCTGDFTTGSFFFWGEAV